MAINFPDPTVTQTFTDDNQKTWQWDAATSSWKALLPQVYSQSYVDTAINSLQTQIDGIDIDQHLNTDSAGNNQILSWDGSEYLWIDPTSGTAGPAGADGADGLSAYEVAVSEGFTDSAGAWLDSLVGPAGADGSDGTNGTDGADGLSAYEIAGGDAVYDSAGAWLDSLVGPAGADGSDGTNGTNGTNGADGADGLSAYEVAVSEGFTDSAGAWLDSLVGPAGADGVDGTTADIDTHLNVGTAADGQVLSWDSAGDEYVWIDQTGGSSSYSDDSVNSLLNVNSAGDGQVLSWNDSAGEYVWIDQIGGGSSYSDNNVNLLLNVDSAGYGQVLSWDSAGEYTWTDNLQTRKEVDTSSISITSFNPSESKDLPSGGYHLGYIEGFKTYSLLKIKVSHSNLWVTIYTDSTSMGNDASRSHTVDPDPGSGVIAEVISSSSNQELIMTPTTIGFNMDNPEPNNNIYLKIVNLGGTSLGGDYSVTLTILRMEK